jgi:hypothetical protein
MKTTKKKSPKLKLKTLPKRTEHVHIRFFETERMSLQQLADQWTAGDLSKWVRHAALNYKPSAAELESA